jgi:hypothetical protein
MKRMIIITLALTMVAALCFQLSIKMVMGEIETAQSKYKTKVGQNFVLEKDTLKIIDYSFSAETFTLSNGKIVSAVLVFNEKK